MAWIVEYTQPGQAIVKVALYDSEDYALVAACASLMLVITNDWDRSSPDCMDRAFQVSDACRSSNWREAIRLFNDWEGDGDYEFMHHYNVYERNRTSV